MFVQRLLSMVLIQFVVFEFMLSQFCTFDITDLYTMLPQEESLGILTEFLLEFGYNKIKGVLLAPIFLTVNREYTFINDIDVIRQLEKYAADGHLTSRTKFITIDVENLYTMIPREGARQALERFLLKYSDHGKIGTLSIDHILKMARVIWDTNCFVYQNKY